MLEPDISAHTRLTHSGSHFGILVKVQVQRNANTGVTKGIVGHVARLLQLKEVKFL